MTPVGSSMLRIMTLHLPLFGLLTKQHFSLFPYSYVICQLKCQGKMILSLFKIPAPDGCLRLGDVHLCQAVTGLGNPGCNVEPLRLLFSGSIHTFQCLLIN